MLVQPRHSECHECVFFDPKRLKRECLGCGAGENFDPIVEAEEPSDEDLFTMLKDWSHDDN